MSFSRSIIHNAKLQSQFSDVYFYQFSYYGPMGVYDVYIEGADRITHTEDVFYMWPTGNNSDMGQYPDSDVLTSKRYVTLFANFAKTLNPTPEPSSLFQNITWPKITPDNFPYLNINDTLELRINPKENTYEKWVEVYETMAIKPYDTF
ncbi:hypothetical protein NQ318_000113 [Aromia moschata]|uniref:Carboxylesterase type B domain-containing protein n=1 Tax=Aromia moschata TaxID=1265417 RepID=A0AAV8XNE3_9CUCU|nr:hypothetical protein NQ318_000113 [Aromia moschata]